MSECRIVYGDAASIYPAALDRFSPGEVDAIELDLTDDVDCQGAGVTIVTATPAIHPDDDDGLLTLGATTTSGLIVTQFLTFAADTTQRNYMLTFTIALSDTRSIKRSVSFPVIETRRLNA